MATANRKHLGSWYIVNLVFNKIIYNRFYAWWSKYNYVLAAALDTGLAISGIVIFFAGEFLAEKKLELFSGSRRDMLILIDS